VQGDCDVHLQVVETTRYTMTLKLTYLFETPGNQDPFADPDFTLRIYQDARQTEALSCLNEHRHALLRRLSGENDELDRRWRRNVVLNKWLIYLLERGHLFAGMPCAHQSLEACR
jgi:uncharacterized protein YqiB (DUF1249 family)